MPRKQYTIHYIYKTVNIITGRYYIGMHSTFNLNDDYIGSGKILWYSIKKYGRENHKKEILEFCKDRNKLKQREKEIVNDDLRKDKLCMNLMNGGEGGLRFFKNKEEERLWHVQGGIAANKIRTKIMAEKVKNDKKFKEKWINNLSKSLKKYYEIHENPMKEKTHSDEVKKKISLRQSGKNNSQFGTMWITNGKESKKINNKRIPKGWKKGRVICL